MKWKSDVCTGVCVFEFMGTFQSILGIQESSLLESCMGSKYMRY